jgi:phage terminase large subunit-like protein
LEDNAAVIIVLTRWHEEDLAGKLLAQMLENGEFAQPWQVLMLSARAEAYSEPEREKAPWLPERDALGRQPGEPLWPEKHDGRDLQIVEAGVGPYDFGSLYQQRPYAKKGGTFEEDWFHVIAEAPPGEQVVKRVRCWDKAATSGGGAWTAGVLMSRLKNGRIVVEHVARGQWSTFQRESRMLEMARLDLQRPGPRTVVRHPQDPGSAGLDSARATNAKLAAAGVEGHFEPVTGSKEVRAGPWSSACEAGIVDLVAGGWNRPFVEEHVSFPRGTFKDQVDASSDAYAQVGIYGITIPMSDMPQDQRRGNRWDVVGAAESEDPAFVGVGIGPKAPAASGTGSRWGVMGG